MDHSTRNANYSGLCKCGCGQPTTIAKYNEKRVGHIKGVPVSYIYHHFPRADQHHSWKGGLTIRPFGGPTAWNKPHIIIAERVLGKRLPPGAHVHHFDENRNNNEHSNLVICENNSYHKLLHTRRKAFAASGNANYRRCSYCGEYDDLANMATITRKKNNAKVYHHRACHNSRQRSDRIRRRQEKDLAIEGTDFD